MRHLSIGHLRNREAGNSRKSSRIYHSGVRSVNLLGIVLGTAGLQVCVGAAAAGEIEILVGGELKFGVTTAEDEQLSDDEGDRGYAFFTNAELDIEAEISPSEDLEIGAEVVLAVDADIDEVNAAETYIFAKGAFGLMQLGRTEGAEEDMALGADTIAAGTGGLDGDTENLGEVEIVNSDDAAKISYYTPRLYGVQVGLSFTPDTGDDEGGSSDLEQDEDFEVLEDHIALGVNIVGEQGELKARLAVVGNYGKNEDSGRNDQAGFAIGGTLKMDDVELGVSYGNNDAEEDFAFVTAGVTVGIGEANTGIGYNYLDEKVDGVTHVVALSGDVPLWEGVELQADVSYADPEERGANLASVLAVELSF